MSTKVREVIRIKIWKDGSGWQTGTQVISDQVIDIKDMGALPKTADDYDDWSWYDLPDENPEDNGYDTKIIVEFYNEDDEPDWDEPIIRFSKWESELWIEHNT
jgi:hypothetical protein